MRLKEVVDKYGEDFAKYLLLIEGDIEKVSKSKIEKHYEYYFDMMLEQEILEEGTLGDLATIGKWVAKTFYDMSKASASLLGSQVSGLYRLLGNSSKGLISVAAKMIRESQNPTTKAVAGNIINQNKGIASRVFGFIKKIIGIKQMAERANQPTTGQAQGMTASEIFDMNLIEANSKFAAFKSSFNSYTDRGVLTKIWDAAKSAIEGFVKIAVSMIDGVSKMAKTIIADNTIKPEKKKMLLQDLMEKNTKFVAELDKKIFEATQNGDTNKIKMLQGLKQKATQTNAQISKFLSA